VKILENNGYNYCISLPCSKIQNLYNLILDSDKIQTILVTREEEGVGIAAGLYLGGKKPFLLIQSSGLGNSFNALNSLIITYEIPLLILASYRGYKTEVVEAQKPFGAALPKYLDAMKVNYCILSEYDENKVSEMTLNNANNINVILFDPVIFNE
jgi:sulfopyruvate decarboxylase alpha subunit